MQRRFGMVLAVIAVGVGGLAFWLQAEPEAEVVEEAGFRDTGMSLEAREELMRSIGYVQQ